MLVTVPLTRMHAQSTLGHHLNYFWTPHILYTPSYDEFCVKISFHCHGNKGRSEENFLNTVTTAVPENTLIPARIVDVSPI